MTEKLRTYYHYYQDLKEKGGPEENTELFESVVELEEDIMAAYGLPPSHTHLQILWQLTETVPLSEEALQETQQQLQVAATEHLMAPVKTNLEVLLEAKNEKLSAFNVLPEIGQPTHDYPIFLFEEMLLKDRATPEAVLQEMEKVKELDCYGEVATLLYYHRKTFRKTKIYKKLKNKLQFLDMYLQQLAAIGDSAEHSIFVSSLFLQENKDAQLLEQLATLPAPAVSTSHGIDPSTYSPQSILLSDPFEMEEIVYAEDTAVTVTGRLHTGSASKAVSLGFDLGDLSHLLAHYPQGLQILALFSQKSAEQALDSPVIINLINSTGSTFLADEHYFKVYKPLVLDEEGTHQIMQDEFYLVDEVVERTAFDAAQVETSEKSLHGLFQLIRSCYQQYLNHLQEGTSEQEARKANSLSDPIVFELARNLYNIEKHGGKVNFD